MTSFFESLNSVLTIFILIIIGYFLKKKEKLTKETGNFISFLVVNITLPCSIVNTITNSIKFDRIYELPFFVGIIIISQLLSIAAGIAVVKFFKVEKKKQGSLVALTAFNNTLFMGMPVSVALFGEKSSPIILYYYIASAILFWTIGVRIIAGGKVTSKFKIPSPIYGALTGFLLLFIGRIFADFALPGFVMDTVGYLAKMTTPLSMIFTGYALGEFGLHNIRIDKSIVLGLTARFLISPLIFIAIICISGVGVFYRNVFIVQAFMPVMASQTIVARQYGADDSYSAIMVTVSTLISLIIIPVVNAILMFL